MKEFDDMKPIQDTFEHFEAQAPEFDALFKGDVLGDASLRHVLQSKLANLETQAPSFESLFAGQTLLVAKPGKRMIPLWAGIAAAAAFFGLILMLPQKIQLDKENFSQIEQHVVHKKTYKIRKQPIEIKEDLLLTQALESPKTIQKLAISSKSTKASEDLITYKEVLEQREPQDSKLTQIKPAKKKNLAVPYERSVEEAYAEAKVKKADKKRERLALGTNLNSSNRLLSLLNTKSTDTYPLQGLSHSYSAAYSTLEGATSRLVTTEAASDNTWVIPSNLVNNNVVLNQYKAVYSLPVSVGLSVSFPLYKHVNIITGLNYSFLSATVSGETSDLSFELKQELHYVGIPLKIAFNFLDMGRFGVYAAAGGAIEKGLSGVQHSNVDRTDGTESNWDHSQKVYGFQTSLTGQLGINFELNKTFNLYFEPGVSYFNPSDQPISSRTEEPYNFNLGLGLRYRIN